MECMLMAEIFIHIQFELQELEYEVDRNGLTRVKYEREGSTQKYLR